MLGLLFYRLRRAGAVLGIGLTAALAGGFLAVAIHGVSLGWVVRGLVLVGVIVFARLALWALGRSRLLTKTIKFKQELRTNPDLGTRPKMKVPRTVEEKSQGSFLKKLFPNED